MHSAVSIQHESTTCSRRLQLNWDFQIFFVQVQENMAKGFSLVFFKFLCLVNLLTDLPAEGELILWSFIPTVRVM